MGLVPHNAINHLNSGFLKAIGEGDIGSLIKSCPQFNDHCDFLACFGGPNEGIDNR